MKSPHINISKAAAIFLLLFAAHPLAGAGEVRTWTAAELFQRADVIVVGQPIKIETTDEKGEIRFGGGKRVPLRYHKARVRIVQVIKGDALGENLLIRYSNQIDTTHAVSRIWLNEGELYLLYLRRTEDGGYVGALDGDFHDGQAAKLLVAKKTEQVVDGKPPEAPQPPR